MSFSAPLLYKSSLKAGRIEQVSKKSASIGNEGVLPIQELRKAVDQKYLISNEKFDEGQYQPSSIDLRLGKKAYRIRSSFLPQKKTVKETLKELQMYEFSLKKGAILERGNIYLIPLLESLKLPLNIKGRTNPKSSTGRLDIFTRVITDNSSRFEDIEAGYRGPLYLEVAPRSFTIKVKTGLTLNQIRFYRCNDIDSSGDNFRQRDLLDNNILIDDKDLYLLHQKHTLLFNSAKPIKKPIIQNGLYMGIEIHTEIDEGVVGYMAKKNSSVIDLSKVGQHRIIDFWEPIKSPHENFLILEPEEFYIFASKESVRIPESHAAEMVEYDAGSGELRTHYAGFFDPGFGGEKQNGKLQGTKAVLEVRPHDVPFRVDDGQIFFKLRYEKMAAVPTTTYGSGIGSNYHNQGLSLSKHFIK